MNAISSKKYFTELSFLDKRLNGPTDPGAINNIKFIAQVDVKFSSIKKWNYGF